MSVWTAADPRAWMIDQLRKECGMLPLLPEFTARSSPHPASFRAEERPRRERAMRVLARRSALPGLVPVVKIEGEITPVMADNIERQLSQYVRPDEVHLFISTSGGDVGAAEAIASAVRRYAPGARVVCTVGRHCASAGIIPLLLGTQRECRRDSKFALHTAASTATLAWPDARALRRRADFCDEHDKSMICRISNICGARRERVALLMREARLLTAAEAKALGLVNLVR
jgi:ATP-dependent protease ClpP protease subunit